MALDAPAQPPRLENFAWRGQTAYAYAGAKGRATLVLPERPAVYAEPFAVEVRFENTGDRPLTAYGVLRPEGTDDPRVAAAALFDANKVYQGDLFSRAGFRHSTGHYPPEFWVRLPPGGFCGTIVPSLGFGAIFEDGRWFGRLPAGRYALQLIYMTTVTAERNWTEFERQLERYGREPSLDPDQLQREIEIRKGLHAQFLPLEMFRSNRVWFDWKPNGGGWTLKRPERTDFHNLAREERSRELFWRVAQMRKPLTKREPVEAERPADATGWREPDGRRRYGQSAVHRATVEVETPTVAPCERLRFRVAFHPSERVFRLFNVFFDRSLAPPARVLVFDAERRYVGDCPLGVAADPRPPETEDFRPLDGGDYGGAVFDVPVRRPGDPEADAAGTLALRPGTYFLQAAYLRRLTWATSRAKGLDGLPADWWRSPKADWEELRSEPVAFVIAE